MYVQPIINIVHFTRSQPLVANLVAFMTWIWFLREFDFCLLLISSPFDRPCQHSPCLRLMAINDKIRSCHETHLLMSFDCYSAIVLRCVSARITVFISGFRARPFTLMRVSWRAFPRLGGTTSTRLVPSAPAENQPGTWHMPNIVSDIPFCVASSAIAAIYPSITIHQ